MIPAQDVTYFALNCRIPTTFKQEPQLARFVVLSASSHRAALGMMTMHLLGFHFVSALEADVNTWAPVAPTT
jgi:hypothetical protein